uniref:Uncharacterized protein n=1 Tax=Arundo donax TaxID=35708 RepID=A0A0A9EHH7_ARUDO
MCIIKATLSTNTVSCENIPFQNKMLDQQY